ncbi:MAG: hypothetical protein E7018_04510 [Alphaproteobacteria bacterium]|nr:hypothetical protein [Alphaproteobacteria bacterium]
MKQIILIVAATACLVGCDAKVIVQKSDNITNDMIVVHRVVTSASDEAGWFIRVQIRDKSGEELLVDARYDQIGDIKYVQPGDTVYFRRTTNNPEILRIGFKD